MGTGALELLRFSYVAGADLCALIWTVALDSIEMPSKPNSHIGEN